MDLPLQPPPEFWQQLKTFWNNGVWVQNNFVRLPLDEPQLFQAIARACQAKGPNAPEVATRFYIAGRELDAFPPQYLPRVEDGNFEGFRRRVRAENGNREFCFLVNLLETVDFGLFSWCLDFARELGKAIGFSPVGISAGLFVGDYQQTPFGVHEDDNHVFTFPVLGRKVMRTWPQPVVKEAPHYRSALEYEPLKDQSQVLDILPGGMSYWSPDRWHIGESAGGGLNVSVTLFALEATHLRNVLARLLSMGGLNATPPSLRETAAPPPGFERIPAFEPSRLAEIAQNPPACIAQISPYMEHAFRPEVVKSFWLKTVSAYGFSWSPPPLEARALGSDAKVRLAYDRPILSTEVTPTEVAVAAHGLLTFAPREPGVAKLIAALNTGETWQVARLQADHAGGSLTASAIGSLLEWLVAARALATV